MWWKLGRTFGHLGQLGGHHDHRLLLQAHRVLDIRTRSQQIRSLCGNPGQKKTDVREFP